MALFQLLHEPVDVGGSDEFFVLLENESVRTDWWFYGIIGLN